MGSEREVIYVLDHAIPETDFRLSRPYPLSTISSDGGRISISGYLGEGNSAGEPWGLLVFEIEEPSVRLVLHGPSWCNLHPQYTRQTDPVACHDIMIQENHGNIITADGRGGKAHQRTGRGHPPDPGTMERICVTSPGAGMETSSVRGISAGRGKATLPSPAPLRANRTRDRLYRAGRQLTLETKASTRRAAGATTCPAPLPGPDFWHFATDLDGTRLITDAGPKDGGGAVWLFDLPGEEEGALANARKIVKPRIVLAEGHPHPSFPLAGWRNRASSIPMKVACCRPIWCVAGK